MNPRLLWGAATFGAGSAAAAICLTRRLAERSGATTSEAHSALPGDDLVPNPQIQTTRAITIHAPVADVWPWVAQLGYHRGGWYTNAPPDKLLWRIITPSAVLFLPNANTWRLAIPCPMALKELRASRSRRLHQGACSPCTIQMVRTSRKQILVGRLYCKQTVLAARD